MVDDFLQHEAPKACAIISDRLTDRSFLSDWTRGTLDPLTASEVKSQVTRVFSDEEYQKISQSDKELLQVPYFLDYAIRTGSPNLKSPTSALSSYFENFVQLGPAELMAVGKAAFDMYNQYRSPSFEEQQFRKLIGDNTLKKLLEAGAVRQPVDGRTQFDHQLKHDYLASKHLAANDSLWKPALFDAITFESNSVESISMTLDFLADSVAGDKFLRLAYDWNLSATVACLVNANKSSSKPFTKEVEAAILSHVAEKLFDPIEATRKKFRIFLSRFTDHPLANNFRACKNLQDVFAAVKSFSSHVSWFRDWRDLFTRVGEPPLSEEEIQGVTSDDSIVGWTASNVIRRFDVNDGDCQQLRSIYRSFKNDRSKDAIRWRVVHSLGPFDKKENVKLLLSALANDPYPWVQYGAARSLIEMAAIAQDPSRRVSMFKELERQIEKMRPPVMEEIARALCYRDPPSGWRRLGSELLDKLRDSQKSDVERDRWKKPIEEFENFCSRKNSNLEGKDEN